MSVDIRRALYGRMSSDVTLNALLAPAASGYSKAIYYQVAPQGAQFPFVIFNKQAGTPSYAFGDRNNRLDEEIWMFKGVSRSESGDPADAIATQLDALLTETPWTDVGDWGELALSFAPPISGRYLRRESDLDYSEVVDGVAYRHAGALFRLIYEPAPHVPA